MALETGVPNTTIEGMSFTYSSHGPEKPLCDVENCQRHRFELNHVQSTEF